MKTYGTERLGAMIARTCSLARYLEERIRTEPQLELLAPVQLNIVCFRYRAADANRLNGEIVADIQESGIAAPSTTVLDGQLAIRAAIVNHRTDTGDIDALISAVLDFGAQRASGNDCPVRAIAQSPPLAMHAAAATRRLRAEAEGSLHQHEAPAGRPQRRQRVKSG